MIEIDTSKKTLSSFDLSFAELEKINKELENEEISVDLMSDYAKKCLPLIRACKSKLTETQGDIDNLIKELDQPK